jgi:hypothetical protein
MLLLSLPLAEAAELGTPRADARLYKELMLMRLLAGGSDTEERALRRAGSGRPRCWTVSVLEPACIRGVSGSSGSAASVAKSLGEEDSPAAAVSVVVAWFFGGGGGIDTSALSAWASVPGSASFPWWTERADDEEGPREWEPWPACWVSGPDSVAAAASGEDSINPNAFSAVPCGGKDDGSASPGPAVVDFMFRCSIGSEPSEVGSMLANVDIRRCGREAGGCL